MQLVSTRLRWVKRRHSDQVAFTSAYHPMRVRQTKADWLLTSDGVQVFDLGMQHPGEDPRKYDCLSRTLFSSTGKRNLTNRHSQTGRTRNQPIKYYKWPRFRDDVRDVRTIICHRTRARMGFPRGNSLHLLHSISLRRYKYSV